MDKCYVIEWNDVNGDEPGFVRVYKSFDLALKYCVEAIEEAKETEEEYYAVDFSDTGYNIVAEASRNEPGVYWVELHQTRHKEMPRVIEWYKITETEFSDNECS